MPPQRKLVYIWLAILLLILTKVRVTGLLWHEYLGVIFFIIMVLHLRHNKSYLSSLIKIKQRLSLRSAINIIAVLTLAVLLVTAVLISRRVIPLFSLKGGEYICPMVLHETAGILLLILLAIHLGEHLQGIIYQLHHKFPGLNNPLTAKIGWLSSIVLIGYGGYAFFKLGLHNKLLMGHMVEDGSPGNMLYIWQISLVFMGLACFTHLILKLYQKYLKPRK